MWKGEGIASKMKILRVRYQRPNGKNAMERVWNFSWLLVEYCAYLVFNFLERPLNFLKMLSKHLAKTSKTSFQQRPAMSKTKTSKN